MKSFKQLAQAHKRIFSLMACDAIIVVCCGFLAMFTRFAPNISSEAISDTWHGIPRLIASYIGVFAICGLYSTHWRYFNVNSYVKQILGCIVGFGISYLWDELQAGAGIRRYYLFIVLVFTMCGICCFRVLLKLIRNARDKRTNPFRVQLETVRRLVNIFGVGDEKVGYSFEGERSECEISELASTLSALKATDIVISYPGDCAEIINICLDAGCFVKKL